MPRTFTITYINKEYHDSAVFFTFLILPSIFVIYSKPAWCLGNSVIDAFMVCDQSSGQFCLNMRPTVPKNVF